MKILVLGGTQFLGRNFVESVITSNKNQYDIVLANRNVSNTQLFRDIKRISIDRTESARCRELQGVTFDIVVDFSCYNLKEFLSTFKHLNFKRYIFISSTAVSYMEANKRPRQDGRMLEYAINKKEVESFIQANIQNYTIIRPCVVYGEHDNTNRFYLGSDGNYYWKYTGGRTGAGTVSVEKVTKVILDTINDNESRSHISVCEN